MTKARRIRGLKALVHDAVDAVTDLVGEGHESTARNVLRVTDVAEPVRTPARVVNGIRRVTTRGVLETVKLVNRVVERVSDAGLDVLEKSAGFEDGSAPAVPMRSDTYTSPDLVMDAGLGLLNAAIGDHLDRRNNALGLGMVLRIRDRYVDPLDAEAVRTAVEGALAGRRRRIAVFVHGLGTTEWSWVLEAHAYHGDPTATFGSLLERDLGIVPVYVRYNTGRRVSVSGRALDAALRRVADGTDLEEIALVGHSMGGLVVRSACHYGAEACAPWIPLVRRVFCLGSPHSGAPLERFGNLVTGVLGAIDLPGTVIPARILAARSAGIKDLRHGSLVDEDWVGRDPDALRDAGPRAIALLPGVAYHFVSATLTEDPDHPLGQLVGDLLVQAASSAGPVVATEGTFTIETKRFGGVMHHQLQNHPAIYQVLRAALDDART